MAASVLVASCCHLQESQLVAAARWRQRLRLPGQRPHDKSVVSINSGYAAPADLPGQSRAEGGVEAVLRRFATRA
jgi:hypothetical protein